MCRPIGSVVWMLVVAAGLALSGCKPSYPKCENDDHCKEKGEVCANGQCVFTGCIGVVCPPSTPARSASATTVAAR